MNEVPFPTDAPPATAAYQLNFPALPVAAKRTVPLPQREDGTVALITGMLCAQGTTFPFGLPEPPLDCAKEETLPANANSMHIYFLMIK